MLPLSRRSPSKQHTRGIKYKQTVQVLYLGDLINETTDIVPEIKQGVRPASACLDRFKRELYNMKSSSFTLKMPMLKSEVIETLLYR